MRGALLGTALVICCCGGTQAPPTAPPSPAAPPAARGEGDVVAPAPQTFSASAVTTAVFAPLFSEGREWKLTGNRHLVSAGDAVGSLHYKVIVRCHVAEVVEAPVGLASRVECVNFPEDSAAVNPLEGVWVAGSGGLYRADQLPATDAEWSQVLRGSPVFHLAPRPFERKGECVERVTDGGDRWCWSETCAGESLLEGKLCFSEAAALLSVEASSIGETSDVLALSVLAEAAKSAPPVVDDVPVGTEVEPGAAEP